MVKGPKEIVRVPMMVGEFLDVRLTEHTESDAMTGAPWGIGER